MLAKLLKFVVAHAGGRMAGDRAENRGAEVGPMMRRIAPRRRRMSALAGEARCVVLLPARLDSPAPGGDTAKYHW
jgi:hypothetical protein